MSLSFLNCCYSCAVKLFLTGGKLPTLDDGRIASISDGLVGEFEQLGIKDVFLVTGGAIAGFTDALARNGSFRLHYMLSEQSAGIAAEAYGFSDGKPALLVITSGPGVTNAITPVAAAWTNSAPIIVISGQARVSDVIQAKSTKNRQIGNQHLRTDILASTIVKLFEEPMDSFNPRAMARKLYSTATTGRPGPVWFSFPGDLQRFKYNDGLTREFKNDAFGEDDSKKISLDLNDFVSSAKPLILLGNGARGNIESILAFAETFQIPLTTTWPGMDLVPDDHPLYLGRPGSIPSSWLPNLAISNCDNLLIIGVRLDLGEVGYNPESFAENASVIRIEIDSEEFMRIPERANWQNLIADIRNVDFKANFELSYLGRDWMHTLSEWRTLPGPNQIRQNITDGLSTYEVIANLNAGFPAGLVATGSSGTCIEMTLQSWKVKPRQRIINSCGLGSMGFALAASYGLIAKYVDAEVLCIESDGSLQMNIHDLSLLTGKSHKIKLVVLDSMGYKSISLSQARQGQQSHGNSAGDEITYLSLEKILEGLAIPCRIIKHSTDIEESVVWLSNIDESAAIIYKVSKKEEALPRLISKLNSEGKMITPKMNELSPQSNSWPEPR